MSLLNFLKIAAPSGGPPRPRKLAIESLERRAVLAVLDPLLVEAVAETVVEPTEETTPPITEETESQTEPITSDPLLLEEPATEEPLPTEEPADGEAGGEDPGTTAPEILNAGYARDGMWVSFSGLVQDDEPVGGFTIYFSTDQGDEFVTTVEADGSFQTHSVLIQHGAQVTFYTIDSEGNYSDYIMLIV